MADIIEVSIAPTTQPPPPPPPPSKTPLIVAAVAIGTSLFAIGVWAATQKKK